MDMLKRLDSAKTKGSQLAWYLRSSAANPGVPRVGTGVLSILISNPGAGYVSVPSVTFAAPEISGVTATGFAILDGGKVTAILITNHGSGYSAAPAITIDAAPEGGTTATATASLTDSWHAFNYRKQFGINVKEKLDQSELEGGVMTYPEYETQSGEFSIEVPCDEYAMKFLRDELGDEFSLLLGMGKTHQNKDLFVYVPRVIFNPAWDYASNNRFMTIKGMQIAVDSSISCPNNLPTECKVTYSKFVVPAGTYSDPESA